MRPVLLCFNYYKDRRVRVHSKQTPRNIELLRRLEPVIASYSPTLYLPGSLLKSLLCLSGDVEDCNSVAGLLPLLAAIAADV